MRETEGREAREELESTKFKGKPLLFTCMDQKAAKTERLGGKGGRLSSVFQ